MYTPPEVLKALAALDGSRDFAIVLDWVRKTEEETVATLLSTIQPVLVHQRQGYASALRDFIGSATTANKSLPRLG